MTLYTVIPEEEIFKNASQERTEQVSEFLEMAWEGRLLLVERLNDEYIRVERILQPCGIQDFLEPAFQPGTVLQLNKT
ncbi:YlzJ-like family protein [Paenibacillus sp. SC116]|uniref:YlzJ-like family protein n=1 Tax=Paenibacillus sp. SC116 TaxID=2968986 RepID=UPI00215B710B|nr:YlzJ-like family protein [Paenibacillus sp. SC116]MCR8845511.1 YlzJ-like family protein [Paenibacillus sp. SC116]